MRNGQSHTLQVEGGYSSWRTQALRALAAGWPPQALTWTERTSVSNAVAEQMALDYTSSQTTTYGVSRDAPQAAESLGAIAEVRVSRALAGMLRSAAAYRSPDRWAFLYRVLWRWHCGDRSVASAADEDGTRLHAMVKAVRRTRHDMIAYVRFRRHDRADMPQYWAWYEPEHDVLANVAEYFARRMGESSWSIGTPQGAALWDGRTLRFSNAPIDGAAIRVAAGSADQVEPLWLRYYQSIFNPARLNETALQQRMPVRFWNGLPEARLIPSMIADARSGASRVGQVGAVAAMPGRQVSVDAQRAQPLRAAPDSLDLCRRCELWRHATQPVPGKGAKTARLMLVGEQPGDHEDLAGQVFVGPAGRVLDEALRHAGVARDSLYLTNAVKHFKWIARGKRRMHKTPAQREVEACAHWLHRELAQVRPAVIITLGATALRTVLGREAHLQDYLGAPVRLGQAWLIATWHPSYALRVGGTGEREKVLAGLAEAIAQGQRLAMDTAELQSG